MIHIVHTIRVIDDRNVPYLLYKKLIQLRRGTVSWVVAVVIISYSSTIPTAQIASLPAGKVKLIYGDIVTHNLNRLGLRTSRLHTRLLILRVVRSWHPG